jgi:hypothetical protein
VSVSSAAVWDGSRGCWKSRADQLVVVIARLLSQAVLPDKDGAFPGTILNKRGKITVKKKGDNDKEKDNTTLTRSHN